MSNLSLVTADTARIVGIPIEQITKPGGEAITALQVVREDPSTGKWTLAKATDATEAAAYGVATRTPEATGLGITAIRKGVIDGLDLSSLDYGDPVYLSDTDGRLSDSAGTVTVIIGHVTSAFAAGLGNSADKVLLVDVQNQVSVSIDTDSVTSADGLTVGGVIVPQHLEITAHVGAAALMVDQSFFIANRAYQVVAIKEVHAVAESTAGTLKIQVVKDTSTNAPGAGTDLLTNNTNTGFDGKATANTVQSGTLTATTADLQLAAGDRLSLDFSASATELVGVTVTVSLKRI